MHAKIDLSEGEERAGKTQTKTITQAETMRAKSGLSHLLPNVGMDKTSLERTYAYDIVNDAARRLDFSQTNMYLIKNEFRMDIYCSENQIALSSHYTPRCATSWNYRAERDKPNNKVTNLFKV